MIHKTQSHSGSMVNQRSNQVLPIICQFPWVTQTNLHQLIPTEWTRLSLFYIWSIRNNIILNEFLHFISNYIENLLNDSSLQYSRVINKENIMKVASLLFSSVHETTHSRRPTRKSIDYYYYYNSVGKRKHCRQIILLHKSKGMRIQSK